MRRVWMTKKGVKKPATIVKKSSKVTKPSTGRESIKESVRKVQSGASEKVVTTNHLPTGDKKKK